MKLDIENLRNVFSKALDYLVPQQKYVYVAIGDSTVEGVGASHSQKSYPALIFETLKRQVKRAEFHNLGKGGAKVADVVANQLHPAISLEPDLITLSVGANDLRARTKLSRFEHDLSYLIKTLREQSQAKIIINNIPDFSQLPSLPFIAKLYSKVMLTRYNKIIENEAKKADVLLVDLYSQSKIFIKKYPEFVSPDGFHPSDAGYALWATAIITQVRDLFVEKHIIRPQV